MKTLPAIERVLLSLDLSSLPKLEPGSEQASKVYKRVHTYSILLLLRVTCTHCSTCNFRRTNENTIQLPNSVQVFQT